MDSLTGVDNKSSCDKYKEMVRHLRDGSKMKIRETSADLDTPVCFMPLNDTKKLLKKKEFDRLRDCGLEGRFEKWEEVNEFEPQCEEMRALIEDHVVWLADKSAKKK